MNKPVATNTSCEIRVLSPTAILGYGFPEESFAKGLARQPHVIAVDAGSTDPGPFYLGAGVSFTNREAVKRDLRLILQAGRRLDIPVIFGSAGGAGARPHVDWMVAIMREIAFELELEGEMTIITADVDQDTVLQAFEAGKIRELTPGHALSRTDISESTHIVAQMGEEPIIAALRDGADVIVTGRCYDPSVFAALPISLGFDPALALHMGKILECAAIAAWPGSGSDCMLGTLNNDAFVVEPLAEGRVCTVESVAGHSLYEKSDPYVLPGPGGWLDLRECEFEQLDDRRVRVSGTRFVRSEKYEVKLEGARPVGFRTISIAGARDPIFIANVDEIIEGVRRQTQLNFADFDPAAYRVEFKLYGRDGVMGALEPHRDNPAHELGIIIDVTAQSQSLADTICAFVRSSLLHFGYPGRISTGGNLAMPYSPSDFQGGEIFQFSLYHLLPLEAASGLFPATQTTLQAA